MQTTLATQNLESTIRVKMLALGKTIKPEKKGMYSILARHLLGLLYKTKMDSVMHARELMLRMYHLVLEEERTEFLRKARIILGLLYRLMKLKHFR